MSKKDNPPSVAAAIEKCLLNYIRQLDIRKESMTMTQYIKLNDAICSMRQQYSELIFKTQFSLNNDSTVQLTEVSRAITLAVTAIPELKLAPKQTPVDLDKKIPGFSKLSPRSQANSAVTQLIKEMKAKKVTPSQIFSISSDKDKDTALNKKLKESFKKLLPTVSDILIDVACSSFGFEVATVSKATFLNTFDEEFDKSF